MFVSDGALAAGEGEAPNLSQAALVGLLRSAHSEHPGRFGLVDLDRSEASRGLALRRAGERGARARVARGLALAPRLGLVALGEQAPSSEPFDPQGTVLITGGTGGLGALLARHLAVEQGVERLLLVSRSGHEAEGASALREELRSTAAMRG